MNKSKASEFLTTVTVASLVLMLAGCSAAWQVEYGRPRAQFLSSDVARIGAPFTRNKITVKGTVTRVDLRDPRGPMVYLSGGVQCNFGRLTGMAASCAVGHEVLVDGFLRRCDKGGVLLDPVVLTTAPFSPQH